MKHLDFKFGDEIMLRGIKNYVIRRRKRFIVMFMHDEFAILFRSSPEADRRGLKIVRWHLGGGGKVNSNGVQFLNYSRR